LASDQTPDAGSLVEILSEGDRNFVRLRTGRIGIPLLLARPRLARAPDEEPTAASPTETLLDPEKHNAVRVTVRQNVDADLAILARWAHRGADDVEEPSRLPATDPHPVDRFEEWTEVTLPLADSPRLETAEVVRLMVVSGIASLGEQGVWSIDTERTKARFAALDETHYVDIDKIELLSLPVAVPELVITAVHPTRGREGTEVTLEGAGFGHASWQNVVFFGEYEVEVIEATGATLRVKAGGHGSMPITVRGAAGQKAIAPAPFVVIGRPWEMEVVSGSGQSAPVGSTLAPMTVVVVDRNGNGVPGVQVAFRITRGTGVLSVREAVSELDGTASTSLTLGNEPGEVTVEAKTSPLEPLTFVAVATP
jgi:hypothetical protein